MKYMIWKEVKYTPRKYENSVEWKFKRLTEIFALLLNSILFSKILEGSMLKVK